MKKICSVLLIICILALPACTGETPIDPPDIDWSEPDIADSTTPTPNTTEPDTQEPSTLPNTSALIDKIENTVEADIEKTIEELEVEFKSLSMNINSYKDYIDVADKIQAFYAKIEKESQKLCLKMYDYALQFAEIIIEASWSMDDMYDNIDILYDCIYNDASDDIYDGIYNGVLDDMYDAFYNGALDDWEDDISYSEWSSVCSAEYKQWAKAQSECYQHYADMQSDIYKFYSSLGGELWSKDIDDAKEEIEDFREALEKLKSKIDTNKDPDNADDSQDSTKNNTVEKIVVENYSFELSNYWKEEESTIDELWYSVEQSNNNVIMCIQYPKETDDNYEVTFDGLYADNDNMIKMFPTMFTDGNVINYEILESSKGVKGILYHFTFTLEQVDASGYCFCFPSPDDRRWFYVYLFHTNNIDSQAYVDNYMKTIRSISNNHHKEADGVDPEFKAMMDAYEEFFDEYCEFMKKYMANPTDFGLLMEYAEYMTKYAETIDKLEDINNNELSSENLQYYLEVYGRITKMLLDIYK